MQAAEMLANQRANAIRNFMLERVVGPILESRGTLVRSLAKCLVNVEERLAVNISGTINVEAGLLLRDNGIYHNPSLWKVGLARVGATEHRSQK